MYVKTPVRLLDLGLAGYRAQAFCLAQAVPSAGDSLLPYNTSCNCVLNLGY